MFGSLATAMSAKARFVMRDVRAGVFSFDLKASIVVPSKHHPNSGLQIAQGHLLGVAVSLQHVLKMQSSGEIFGILKQMKKDLQVEFVFISKRRGCYSNNEGRC